MLKGKVAVITGGSRGIGRAIALKMAESGADIAIIYAGDEDAARSACEQARAWGTCAERYRCDVSDYAAAKDTLDSILAAFGRIDILVNNAGVTRDALVLRMSEADFDTVLDINLKGAFNMIRHSAMQLIRGRGGRIINIASVSGLMGNAGQANYAAAKAGMIGLTKTVARELATRNITCNAIAPGYIDTDMTRAMPDSIREGALAHIPMKRIGAAEDIANMAVFLASDLAGYITGEVIRVDGGLCM